MFRKCYIGHHGYNTYVRGVWRIVDEEYFVRITAVGREDDEFVVGETYSLDEINGITEGDVFAYQGRAELHAAA